MLRLQHHPVHLDPPSLLAFRHAFSETDKLAYLGVPDDGEPSFFLGSATAKLISLLTRQTPRFGSTASISRMAMTRPAVSSTASSSSPAMSCAETSSIQSSVSYLVRLPPRPPTNSASLHRPSPRPHSAATRQDTGQEGQRPDSRGRIRRFSLPLRTSAGALWISDQCHRSTAGLRCSYAPGSGEVWARARWGKGGGQQRHQPEELHHE